MTCSPQRLLWHDDSLTMTRSKNRTHCPKSHQQRWKHGHSQPIIWSRHIPLGSKLNQLLWAVTLSRNLALLDVSAVREREGGLVCWREGVTNEVERNVKAEHNSRSLVGIVSCSCSLLCKRARFCVSVLSFRRVHKYKRIAVSDEGRQPLVL